MMISEFEQWLRSRTNQEKRPFQEETVLAYAKAARALDAWMTASAPSGRPPPAPVQPEGRGLWTQNMGF